MESNEHPFGRDSGGGFPFWSIAAAVCLGTVGANAITWAAAEVRINWELNRAAAVFNDRSGQVRQSLERSQRELSRAAQRQTEELERAAQQRSQQQAAQREEAAEQQRIDYDRIRQAQQETTRRETAWKRFYKPSPACAGASSTVECANEHIRATREFERRFAAGEF